MIFTEATFPSGQKLQIAQGDITAEAVDAIVNAANEHLQHGGGVAGAISMTNRRWMSSKKTWHDYFQS